jgi:hypothetical protein
MAEAEDAPRDTFPLLVPENDALCAAYPSALVATSPVRGPLDDAWTSSESDVSAIVHPEGGVTVNE